MILCPLCYHRFEESGACNRCGLAGGCAMIKCPNCGYEFVEKSKILEFLRRIFRFFKRERKGD